MRDKPIPRRAFLKNATAGIATAAASSAQAQSVPGMPAARAADVALRNGRIITVDRDFRIASAVAITGERIVAVGSVAEIARHITPDTRVVDLKGRAVVPGLIDGHAHMDREGLKLVYPALGPVRSIRDIQERIAELARGKPAGEWIVTMPIGDPPYYFDVPDMLAEKRSGRPARSSTPPRPSPSTSARSGVFGAIVCLWCRLPTVRRCVSPASPATRPPRCPR